MALLYPAGYTFLTSNGQPVASGSVYFYETGTETLKSIYSDVELSVAASNPVSLSADGRYSGNIYGSGDYTVKVVDSTDATVFSRDDVFGWEQAALTGSKTHDFDGTDGATTTLTVSGAAAGDDVLVTWADATADVVVRGYVSAADTVTLVKTGAGNPGSLTYYVRVFKR